MRYFSLTFMLLVGACFKHEPCYSSVDCGGQMCVQGFCDDKLPASSSSDGDATGPSSTGNPTTTLDSSSGTGTGSGTTGADDSTTGVMGSCLKMDMLFVIDQSSSMEMGGYEEVLKDAIETPSAAFALYSAIIEQVDDFHIGFTTASIMPELTKACGADEVGNLSHGYTEDLNPEACFTHELGGKPYITKNANTLAKFADAAACLLGPGSQTEIAPVQDNARPIQAVLGAIDPERNADGACNNGFARNDGTPLLIFMFSNSDQSSFNDGMLEADSQKWWEKLVEVRQYDPQEAPDKVGVVSITLPVGGMATCSGEQPEMMEQFFTHINPEHRRQMDLCALKPGTVVDVGEFIGTSFHEVIAAMCAP